MIVFTIYKYKCNDYFISYPANASSIISVFCWKFKNDENDAIEDMKHLMSLANHINGQQHNISNVLKCCPA